MKRKEGRLKRMWGVEDIYGHKPTRIQREGLKEVHNGNMEGDRRGVRKEESEGTREGEEEEIWRHEKRRNESESRDNDDTKETDTERKTILAALRIQNNTTKQTQKTNG